MSPNDLCTIEFIDKLIEAGIDSFKIEGRKRSPEYVAKTVSVYRRAIDLYFSQRDEFPQGKLTDDIKKEMLGELKQVYNRGFSSGFYFDVPSSEDYANIHGSKATKRKEYLGKVLNYFLCSCHPLLMKQPQCWQSNRRNRNEQQYLLRHWI